jgi:hypothetical protein
MSGGWGRGVFSFYPSAVFSGNESERMGKKMEHPPVRKIALLSALPVLLAAAGAGPGEGTAEGRLVVGGRTTKLAHAYARAQRDMFDGTEERILIVLSDVPLAPEEFLEQFPGLKPAAKGKAHVVTVELNGDKSVGSGSILHDAFASTESFCGSGTHVFRAKTFNGKVIEGTLATQAPGEFQTKTFEYRADFRAPLWRRPAPTATGAEAARTAPGTVALAFVKAVTSGDKAAAKKLLAPDAEAAKALDGPQATDVLRVLGSYNPRPGVAKVETVWMLGDGAEVTVSGKAPDGEASHTMILALIGNEWRVAQEMTRPWF